MKCYRFIYFLMNCVYRGTIVATSRKNKLPNSKERITNPLKMIPNLREWIPQFNMMIFFSVLLLKILKSLQDFGNSKMPIAGSPLNLYHVKHIFIG